MKTILSIIVLVLSVSFSNAQETKKGQSITVTINKISNNNGSILLSLHTKDTFMKGKGIQTIKSNIVDGKITATFTHVEPGTYAILALHDANDNNTMDYEANGMPKESYGASNNSMSFGPPEFDTAKFDVKHEDIDMTIIF